jgi:hypothetical protein
VTSPQPFRDDSRSRINIEDIPRFYVCALPADTKLGLPAAILITVRDILVYLTGRTGEAGK